MGGDVMKQFKGTPGAWDLVIDDDSEDGVITSDFRDGMIEIAVVIGAHPESGFDSEFQMEQLANAKLIAAAPELLEALQTIVGYIKQDGSYSPLAIESLELVINKALGEER
ncbi:ead/Ea22-like family protein [Yersinia phage vB_YenS_P400]|nr:ead/Ea22-like family protein [Yersinia phage vB_YenS_P400]